jgi:hypothetical protein
VPEVPLWLGFTWTCTSGALESAALLLLATSTSTARTTKRDRMPTRYFLIFASLLFSIAPWEEKVAARQANAIRGFT